MMFVDDYDLVYLLALLATSIYWFLTRNHNYWRDRSIPGPTPAIGFGTFAYEILNRGSNRRCNSIAKYGKIYGKFNANVPYLVVAEPALIKDILVKDFNMFSTRGPKRLHPATNSCMFRADIDQWRHLRPLLTPIFSAYKLKQLYMKIVDHSERMAHALYDGAQHDNEIDLTVFVERFIVDVGVTTIFHGDSDDQTKEGLLKYARNMLITNTFHELIKIILPKGIYKWTRHLGAQNEHTIKYFFKYFERLIAHEHVPIDTVNRKGPIGVIKTLLYKQRQLSSMTSNEKTMTKVTNDEIYGNAWLFFMAHFLMTRNALLSALYELSINDDIQQRLYEELNTIDSAGDYEQLLRLPFLDAVISETLRMHSSSNMLVRKAGGDYTHVQTGSMITKGLYIEIPIQAIHDCEKYFPCASRFDPDRFMPERKHTITPYTYLTFGAGPRSCVGERLSLMEMKICLAQLLRRMRFYRTSGTDIPLKLHRNQIVNESMRVIIGVEMR